LPNISFTPGRKIAMILRFSFETQRGFAQKKSKKFQNNFNEGPNKLN